jgi:hypothetical protein
MILLLPQQPPFHILLLCGGVCLGLSVASQAESLGRLLAQRMQRSCAAMLRQRTRKSSAGEPRLVSPGLSPESSSAEVFGGSRRPESE